MPESGMRGSQAKHLETALKSPSSRIFRVPLAYVKYVLCKTYNGGDIITRSNSLANFTGIS